MLKLATETKIAFYTVQAQKQLLDRLKVVAETNETAAEFTKRLHDAGNTSDLELANQQGSYEQSRLEVAQTELQVRRDRERLNRLMGVWGDEHQLDDGRSSAGIAGEAKVRCNVSNRAPSRSDSTYRPRACSST